VATEANFSKYTARTLTLSNKYLVKLGSIRKFMLKRRANKIYEAKSDPALLDKIFSKMEPDELVDYARDILDIQDEILRIMEKEVIPQKTKVPLHGMGLRKKEEKESND
jgi:hypothetical protein